MEQIRRFLARQFAEKQIYVRSRGQVVYIPVSGRSLVAIFALFVVLSAWVGYASINALFQSGIAAQHERSKIEMQLAYESDLNRLQLAYDDLSAQLVLARDWFGETTTKMENRHNDLTRILEQHATISSDLRDMQKSFSSIAKSNRRDRSKTELVGRIGQTTNMMLESRSRTKAKNDRPVALTVAATSLPIAESESVPYIPKNVYQRMTRLETRQLDLLDALEEGVDLKITEFERVIADIGIIDMEKFMTRVLPGANSSIGGPYIPLPDKPGLNTGLHQQLYRISSNLERLEGLSKSLARIPLALPIHNYRVTSGFGPRLDPFKKRAAFHAGIDFGTSTGTPVYASLQGTVIRTGYKGPYGLVVEIDHGNGFRSRYGHLALSRVYIGQRVEFQQHIADAGNSGRSTGPHLHYEIWYDGKVRDPIAFLDAGKQIYNIAETISSAVKHP